MNTFVELRSTDGLTKFEVTQLQNFTFPCERPDRKPFTLRLGLVKQGLIYSFCISKSDKDSKAVPNGVKGYRDQTTWKTFNERMIRDLVPDDIDGLGKSDRKLYRQLLKQFIETQDLKFKNSY